MSDEIQMTENHRHNFATKNSARKETKGGLKPYGLFVFIQSEVLVLHFNFTLVVPRT